MIQTENKYFGDKIPRSLPNGKLQIQGVISRSLNTQGTTKILQRIDGIYEKYEMIKGHGENLLPVRDKTGFLSLSCLLKGKEGAKRDRD